MTSRSIQKWRDNNREKYNAYCSNYRKTHDSWRKWKREYEHAKYWNDPEYRKYVNQRRIEYYRGLTKEKRREYQKRKQEWWTNKYRTDTAFRQEYLNKKRLQYKLLRSKQHEL